MTAVRRALALMVAGLALVVVAVTVAAPAALADPPLPSADPFYTYTGSLAGVAPGTILRRRTIATADLGTSHPHQRHSGALPHHRRAGPAGGHGRHHHPAGHGLRAHQSYRTAYDALGSECDPSHTLQGGNSGYDSDEQTLIGRSVAAGYSVIDTDYEGTNLDWGKMPRAGRYTVLAARRGRTLVKHALRLR